MSLYPPQPRPQPRRRRRRSIAIPLTIGIVALLLGAGLTVAAFVLTSRPATSSSAGVVQDSGREACTLMRADKQAGTKPDATRSAHEIDLLQRSANADLHTAGVDLAKAVAGDVQAGLDAVGLLYSGCAALGIPIQ
jgi:hypothetical protein